MSGRSLEHAWLFLLHTEQHTNRNDGLSIAPRDKGDIEAAKMALWRMYRRASLSALEVYAHRRDVEGVELVIQALQGRGADLHPRYGIGG